jgi:hypothetical protein
MRQPAMQLLPLGLFPFILNSNYRYSKSFERSILTLAFYFQIVDLLQSKRQLVATMAQRLMSYECRAPSKH